MQNYHVFHITCLGLLIYIRKRPEKYGKAGLNKRIKFVCIAMCSLVMSLCSRDLHVMSLIAITIY